MGLGGILQRLKTEGVMLVYHDHRSGTLYDWSGNSRVGSPYSGNYFSKNASITTGYTTVTNDATLQAATTGTLITRQSVTRARSTPYLARKLNQFFWVYDIGFNRYDITLNGVSRTLTYTNLVGNFTHAVEFDGIGGTPKGYLNGALVGNYSGVGTCVSSANNLQYGSASSGDEPQTVRYFLWISRKLTAAEHQEVYQQLQALS